MNFKRLIMTSILSLSLISCANNGGKTEPPAKSNLLIDVCDFLESRGVTIENIPYIDKVNDDKVLYTDSYEGDEEYAAYYSFVLEGDVVEVALSALKTDEWDVPTDQTEYGYECLNKEETVEIDILYLEVADGEVPAGTSFSVYAYDDLFNDGGQNDDLCQEYALMIATNIYGDDQAAIEENMFYFFYYFVYYTIDGTDLLAANNAAASYLPDGSTLTEEAKTGTDVDDEGIPYEHAISTYAYDDGVIVEIDTYLSEEEGKIDITFSIFYDGGGADEEENEVDMNLNIGTSGHIAFSTLSFTYIAR